MLRLKPIAECLLRNADIILFAGALVAMVLLMTGCGVPKTGDGGSFFGFPTRLPSDLVRKGDIGAALRPLVWTGGLCIPVGVVVLFITRMERGWIFIGFGVGLCVLSWFLSMLQPWIMLIVAPVIIVFVLYYAWTMFKRLQRNGGLFSSWRKPKGDPDVSTS